MQNSVQIFNNPDFGEIRTVIIENEPWFVGRDVAVALGYAKPQSAVRNNVEEEDTRIEGTLSNGGMQQTLVVNESGLYSLIFGSKLESAKKFKKWVTSEVLPSIRKKGTYNFPQSTDGKIALLAQGHMELKGEIDNVKEDVSGIKEEIETIKNDLPLFPAEADEVSSAVKRRGVQLLGGKQSNAYNDRGLRQRLYNDLYYNLKHNFDKRSYKAIRRGDIERAISVVEQYRPPLFLEEQIEELNGGGMV